MDKSSARHLVTRLAQRHAEREREARRRARENAILEPPIPLASGVCSLVLGLIALASVLIRSRDALGTDFWQYPLSGLILSLSGIWLRRPKIRPILSQSGLGLNVILLVYGWLLTLTDAVP